MDARNFKVLSFLPLLALVVGSIVGSGIFNSPADLGRLANPGWILAAWAITGIGIFSLVRVFQYLAGNRPDLEGGIYSYPSELAGEFAGFNSAYGYWWSALFTNLAYLFAIPKILSGYFPVLAVDKWAAFLLASAILWGYYGLIRAGIKTAGLANVFITGIKLVPLLFVAGVAVFMFKPALFAAPFSRVLQGTGEAVDFGRQIGGSFGVMVFAFLGVESAVTISAKARRAKDVGRVTGIGFFIVLTIYVLVSTLTLGVAPAQEIVNASSPLGAVMGHAVGGVGRHVLNFGFLFSVMGALLSWLLLAAENPYVAAVRGHAFPKAFARTNRRATPVFSLTVTTLITQIVLGLLIAFAAVADIGARGNAPLLQNLYFAAISISVICALLPYVCSALLAIRYARREKVRRTFIYGILSAVFFAAVFAAMAKYAAAAAVIYASGIVLRALVFRERGKKIPLREIAFYALALVIGMVAVYLIASGRIAY